MEVKFKVNSKKLKNKERLEAQINNVIKLFLTAHELKNIGVEIKMGRMCDDFAKNLFTLLISTNDV